MVVISVIMAARSMVSFHRTEQTHKAARGRPNALFSVAICILSYVETNAEPLNRV